METRKQPEKPQHLAALLTFDRLAYEEAWHLQHRLVDQRLNDERLDTLLLLEHGPVYTIGRSGRLEHWHSAPGEAELSARTTIPVHHVERGGSVTYHGPGQLVGYPILRLSRYCAGPKSYMRLLEEVLIRTLGDWNLTARRQESLTGVWIDELGPAKIGALGVRIVRGITMHGFALNVDMDLSPFSRIVPCGLSGCQVTSMAQVLGTAPDVSSVRERIATHFAAVFGLEWRDEAIPVARTDQAPVASPAG